LRRNPETVKRRRAEQSSAMEARIADLEKDMVVTHRIFGDTKGTQGELI
jgi:hypothetical protein